MFDMKKNAGDNAGYQIRITYNTDQNLYHVTGFVVFKDAHQRIEYDRDGATRSFQTMEAAIASIVDYK
jgi:hypothetical protein